MGEKKFFWCWSVSFVKVFICRSRTSFILRSKSIRWNLRSMLTSTCQCSSFRHRFFYDWIISLVSVHSPPNEVKQFPQCCVVYYQRKVFLLPHQWPKLFFFAFCYANTYRKICCWLSDWGRQYNLISIWRRGFVNTVSKLQSNVRFLRMPILFIGIQTYDFVRSATSAHNRIT